MTKVNEFIKELENLCQEVVKKEDFPKFKRNNLLKYLSIQESLPFQTYFKNQFIRLIKKDSLKKHLFLNKEEENPNLIDSIIAKIQIEEKKFKENSSKVDISIDSKDNNNQIHLIDKNDKSTHAVNSKEKNYKKDNNNQIKNSIDKNDNSIHTRNSKEKKDKDKKDNNNQIENLINKNDNSSHSVNSKEKKDNNNQIEFSINKNDNSSHTINSKEKNYKKDNNNQLEFSINKNDNSIQKVNSKKKKNNLAINKSLKNSTSKDDSKSFSNISFNMNIIKEKLEQKKNDIDEIISQKENLLSQIIHENNESNDDRISYFEDTNNLSGEQFESGGIKFIFDLLNCISVKRDFNFYYNIKIKCNFLNNIFVKYKLNEVNEVQLDFVISDLKILDFINMLIYLYPNIIDLNYLKNNPFEKGMDFNKLIQLRNIYKKSQKKIDIFGEIGSNIFNEDHKINQLLKYRKICYNIKELLKKNKKEAEEILEHIKMTKNNKKLILFLTNGEYTKLLNKKFNDEKIFKAQNRYNINSLIIYLNNNYNSIERNNIDNLIMNHDLNKGKNKFIDELINLKKKKLEQSIINDKFKNISFQLNVVEKKLRTIEKDYAFFIKKEKNNLMMNELTSLFFEKEKEINQYINYTFDAFNKIKISEKINFDYEINIILLYEKNDNLDKKSFLVLNDNKIYNIKVYDLEYDGNLFCFNSFEKVKADLIKKRNKKIFIIIFKFDKMNYFTFLNTPSRNLITNYLSYLYFITQKNYQSDSFELIEFHKNHIKIYKDIEHVEKVIINDIENKFEVIKNNYHKFFINNLKYNKILEEYNKSYKYKIMIPAGNNNINEKQIDYENKINEHKQLLIEKISQDISFFLSLSIQNKNNIKTLIEKDFESIINTNDNNVIDLFLENQTITNELRDIMNKFITIIKDNNNNKINMDLSDEEEKGEMDILLNKYYNEIISINGIQEIYDDDEDCEDNKIDEKESISDNGEDIFNNSDVDEDSNKFKNNNEDKTTKNETDKENNFKINYLIEEIKYNLKYSIKLINLKLYYKFFSNVISKIFINDVSKLISQKVIETEK